MPSKAGIREDFYTVTVYRGETGELLGEKWKIDMPSSAVPGSAKGFHREDGPAWTKRDPVTGVVTYEAWYKNDKLHRDQGPARSERDPVTGVVIKETWALNGKVHRTDGPAVTHRDGATGKTTRTFWAVDGESIPWQQRRKSSNSARVPLSEPEAS